LKFNNIKGIEFKPQKIEKVNEVFNPMVKKEIEMESKKVLGVQDNLNFGNQDSVKNNNSFRNENLGVQNVQNNFNNNNNNIWKDNNQFYQPVKLDQNQNNNFNSNQNNLLNNNVITSNWGNEVINNNNNSNFMLGNNQFNQNSQNNQNNQNFGNNINQNNNMDLYNNNERYKNNQGNVNFNNNANNNVSKLGSNSNSFDDNFNFKDNKNHLNNNNFDNNFGKNSSFCLLDESMQSMQVNSKSPYEKFVSANGSVKNFIVTSKYDENSAFIIYKNGKIQTFKLNPNEEMKIIPHQSKMVHLQSSIFISGGIQMIKGQKNKQILNSCYTVIFEQEKDKINHTIISYAPMIEKRERHNMIYLEKMNKVLVCSGFGLQSCEITDLERYEWSKFPDLNSIRSNATICSINDTYVYIIGGFKAEGVDGKYLNSLEFISIKSPETISKGWNLVNLENSFKVNLSLSAMGVVNYSNNSILICGGFGGKEYGKKIYKFEIDENTGVPTQITETNKTLPIGAFFFNNNFIRYEKNVYSYDFATNLLMYDLERDEFTKLS
jgi:hypothetical protein